MLIKVHNVNYKNILTYSDIEMEANQVTFLFGESGSGKSTLLKLINGTVSPTNGKILIEEKNIDSLDTVALRKDYLLIGQSFYLFDLTVRQNFEEFYRYRDLPVPEDAEMQRYLSICCADFPLESYCPSLSGGERQRVAIAIGLSFLPKALLLDEPTSALDAATANLLLQNVTAFCRDKRISLVIVSHDRALADQFADKMITLKR